MKHFPNGNLPAVLDLWVCLTRGKVDRFKRQLLSLNQ
jgi:hypothetical protein